MSQTNASPSQQDYAQGRQIRQAVADFEAVIDGQLQSITMFEAWLDDNRNSTSMPDKRVHFKMASKLKSALAMKKARLLEARQTRVWPAASDAPSWGRIQCRRGSTSANNPVLSVMGPAPDDQFGIDACGEDDIISIETFVGYVAEVCDNIAVAESQAERLARLIAELEESHTSESPHRTIQNHIALLGQYNDVKDIGQRLMGLIAENRHVSVSSMYQDHIYGVGPND